MTKWFLATLHASNINIEKQYDKYSIDKETKYLEESERKR